MNYKLHLKEHPQVVASTLAEEGAGNPPYRQHPHIDITHVATRAIDTSKTRVNARNKMENENTSTSYAEGTTPTTKGNEQRTHRHPHQQGSATRTRSCQRKVDSSAAFPGTLTNINLKRKTTNLHIITHNKYPTTQRKYISSPQKNTPQPPPKRLNELATPHTPPNS
jgi:hypothetical protein